jgi:DNA-directed RNA polymerase subunit N (RpoN/RPB10)
MDYYKEYPVRCKTCNEQIACFSEEYELYLEQGLSEESALNKLGLMNPCSRIAMLQPVIVFHNMENRDIIEGTKMVEGVDLDKDFLEGALTIPKPPTRRPGTGILTGLTSKQPDKGKVRPVTSSLFAGTGRGSRRPSAIEPTVDRPVALSESEGMGISMPIEIPQPTQFVPPENVSIPTINPDPTIPNVMVSVGAGKQTVLLSGRTYLAR